jgi:four helix bundle protein
MRNFRELEIWKEGIELVILIYKITEDFPTAEKYGLISQMKRSVVSIPSNIAEGCRGTNKELIQFSNIALGSSFELETQLIISQRLKYIKTDDFDLLITTLTILQKRINAFRNNIKSND